MSRDKKLPDEIPGGYQMTDAEFSEAWNRYIEGDDSIDYRDLPKPKKKYTKAERKKIFDELNENLKKLKGASICSQLRKKD